MKFKLDKNNLNSLLPTAELARKAKADRLEIELDGDLENLSFLPEMIDYLYPVLDYEIYYQIWLKNFPFCLISPDADDHLLENIDYRGEKTDECRHCSFNNRCSGFPKGYLKEYGNGACSKRDIPEEVMIEVEPKCNFKCRFCFNKISFAKEGRDIKSLSGNRVEKTIDAVANEGIGVIKFTGGEPLLRKDIFRLMKYAKNKELEVRLNTNCSLVDSKTAKKLKGIVDNILIPLESANEKKEAKITGFKNALKKKIEAVKLLKEENIPVVRAGTVMTKENIKNFDQIAQLIFSLPLDEWEVYRPIPILKKNDLVSEDIQFLADKLVDLRKEGRTVFIANAIPFCAIKKPDKLNAVSRGALYDEGHRRMVFDPRGFFKPHYFLDENLGGDLARAWRSGFMKKMRGLEFLPAKCDGCPFVFKCRGGSRQAAKLFFGDYSAPDPLANFNNVKI